MKCLKFLPLSIIFLNSCSGPDESLPLVSIASPSVGQQVSGTAQVQINASDDSGITKVSLFVRGKGAAGPGISVGSATAEPYVIAWYTPNVPNAADVEIYAVAEDGSGNRATSDPVALKTANANTPTLSYLVAYTLPQRVAAASASGSGFVRVPFVSNVSEIVAPPSSGRVDMGSTTSTPPKPISAQAEPPRDYVLEWAWQPVTSAAGYLVWQSDIDLVGPFQKQIEQLATTGTQKYSRKIVGAKVGDRHWGAVTSVINTTESGYSNADDAVFVQSQNLISPDDGAIVASGNPILAWEANPGAQGYLWFISKKPQATATATDWVCTNSPSSTDLLSVSYPARCPVLATGAYYWWTVGVSFNTQNITDGLSFSDTRSFVIP